ncbi:MAG: AtpZ/AtpI family protein [Thermoleophilia bacterium]
MTNATTDDRPEKEHGPGGAQRSHSDEGYRGEERRGSDRRIGERRVAERRRGVDSAGPGQGGKNTAGAGSRERDQSRFWYDFMRFNLTGWSVVVPTLAGLAIGNWIDNRYPTGFSWTLTLMAAGLILGCLNAWYWIRHHDHGGDR